MNLFSVEVVQVSRPAPRCVTARPLPSPPLPTPPFPSPSPSLPRALLPVTAFVKQLHGKESQRSHSPVANASFIHIVSSWRHTPAKEITPSHFQVLCIRLNQGRERPVVARAPFPCSSCLGSVARRMEPHLLVCAGLSSACSPKKDFK